MSSPSRRSAREIAASDDDDSDSGFSASSLEDLSTLIGGGRARPSPRSRDPATTATPQAKRSASLFGGRSPQAIVTKHRFDLKSLAKDARRDSALQASSLRARGDPALDLRQRQTDRVDAEGNGTTGKKGALTKSQSMLSDIVGAGGERDAQKVLRAVQRTDGGRQEMRYCFFGSEWEAQSPTKPPEEAMTGPWVLFTKGNARVREQNLVSGVLYNVVGSMGGMPDPVFLWVLDEICTHKSVLVRTELCNIVAICEDQIAKLITPELLETIWTSIGAENTTMDDRELTLTPLSDETYKDRDWSHLLSVLLLLENIAENLSLEANRYATNMLLRLAMDCLVLCSVEINNQFENTLQALIEAIPSEQWDSFCLDICALLKANFSSQHIRVHALLCLPIRSPRAHLLRRRLAISFLLPPSTLPPPTAPEDTLTIQHVLDRLAQPDFHVTASTDFVQLRAAVLLLDMALDDGFLPCPLADAAAERRFNDGADRLAAKLGEIWRRTNDTGMRLARTEAKSVVEWVQKRVAHTVRTRRQRPKSIFDLPGQEEEAVRRADLPRQQEFMKSFFRRRVQDAQVEKSKTEKTEKKEEEKMVDEEDEVVLDTIVVKGG